ncbi:KR domain-containing protein [Aspergillus pseudocaelatus]|uniref:KR domain-containing protein n=1 Tax=Aspergillus pseudocaelatus TaxID=1825620 RepID=A0ABQ6WKM9_9EURO|nr:KR domain-containing protein [Aspergillus pseudocaelatus]
MDPRQRLLLENVYHALENAGVRLDQVASSRTRLVFLAGGLGGVSRSLAEWMASRGAKHIVFISRSGRINKEVEETTSFIARRGCEYRIFKADITKKAQLTSVFNECREKLPPIKGYIQCSMVLEDVIFETMTYENWQAATEPKIIRSLNLYEALPRPLGFFIMMTSASGLVGNRGQANYAAGNTFPDAFARHLGQQAATLDLSYVTTVGYFGEIPESLTRQLKKLRWKEATCQLAYGLVPETTFHDRRVPVPAYMKYPLFTHLQDTNTHQEHQQTVHDKDYSPEAVLSAAQTTDIAATFTLDAIQKQLAYLISSPGDDIDAVKSITGNRVDSFVAIELRAWLIKDLGADITMTDTMAWKSLTW